MNNEGTGELKKKYFDTTIHCEILSLKKLNIMENFSAIKPGPKRKREDGGLDERQRVAPPNKPKYDPPLKPEKTKPKK